MSSVPIFGQRFCIQVAKGITTIAYWIVSASDLLVVTSSTSFHLTQYQACSLSYHLASLAHYSGCFIQVPLLQYLPLQDLSKTLIHLPFFISLSYDYFEICFVISVFINRLFINSDFSCINTISSPTVLLEVITSNMALSQVILPDVDLPCPAVLSVLIFPLLITPNEDYVFFTDGSLNSLGLASVFIGWNWVQVYSSCLNHAAIYQSGSIADWPSSTRTEIVAVYTTLSDIPAYSTVLICTDSSVTIAGFVNLFVICTEHSIISFSTLNYGLLYLI